MGKAGFNLSAFTIHKVKHVEYWDKAGPIPYMYNKHNVKSSSTDRRGNTTKYLYDNKGNLISVRDAMGNVAYYDYDTMGHLTAIFRADDETGVKQKTTYLYDLMGLPSVVTDALGYEEYYQYNLNGKLIRKTDLPSKNREGDCQRRAESIPMGMMNSDRTCTGIRDRYSPLAIQVTRATGLQIPTMPRQGNTGQNWEGLPGWISSRDLQRHRIH